MKSHLSQSDAEDHFGDHLQGPLEKAYRRIQDLASRFLGYPCNLDFDYSELVD